MQTYYISPTGNDANAGGESTQWRTLASIKRAAPGSTIKVAPGTYAEALIVTTQGLTIEALDPASPPVIDGEYRFPAGKLMQADIVMPDNSKSLGYVNGALIDVSADDVTVRNIIGKRSQGRGVRAMGVKGKPVKNVLFDNVSCVGVRAFGLIMLDVAFCEFRDGELADVQNFAPTWRDNKLIKYGKCAIIERGTNCKITGAHIHHSYGGGIGTLTTEDCEISNCTVNDIWRTGINISGSKRCKVTGNHLYLADPKWLDKCFGGLVYYPETAAGAGSAGPNLDCVMEYNLVLDMGGAAASMADPGVQTTNCTMRNNTFVVRRPGQKITALGPAAPGFVLENNIFVGAPGVVVGATAEFAAGATIRGNVWYGVAPSKALASATDIYTDPLLVDASGDAADAGNFKLRSGSPAAGRGAFAVAVEPVDPPVDPVLPTRDELLLAWLDRGEKWMARGKEIMAMK